MQNIDNEGKRLKYVREKVLNVSQEVFGSAIGRHLSSIQKWESGINSIEPSTKLLFEHVYGINPTWLETGNGEIIFERRNMNAFAMPIHALSGKSYDNLFSKDNVIGNKSVIPADLSHNLADIFFIVADKPIPTGIEKGDLLIISKNVDNYTKSKSFGRYLVEDKGILEVRLLQYIDKTSVVEVNHAKSSELEGFPFAGNVVSLDKSQLKGKVIKAIPASLWKNAAVVLV